MKYFHGVNLPTEPDTSMGQDLSQFPYTLALMGKNNSGELVYTLCLTSKPFCFNPTTQSFEVKAPFELLLQVYYPTENVWVQMPQDSTTSEEDLVFNLALFWNDEILEYATDVSFLVGTNHDIVNTETGEVAFMVCDDVLLPSIPSNIDRSLYPYAYAVKMQEIETAKDVNYLLIVADKPMQTNSDGTNVVVSGTKGFNGSVSVYAESHCEWIGEETEISSDMPVEQDGYTMTLIWSEVAEEKMYAIKESALKNIGNSIRTKTGKTDLITPENMPSEIDGISSGGGLENGYNVMFYDENSEKLAFYSIKQGHSVEAPIYTCKAWQTEDGTEVSFPYTPTGDLVLYANNNTLAKVLYDHYKVSMNDYPYCLIKYSVTTNNEYITVIFGKNITIKADTKDYIMTDYYASGSIVAYIPTVSAETMVDKAIEVNASLTLNSGTASSRFTSYQDYICTNFAIDEMGMKGQYRMDI